MSEKTDYVSLKTILPRGVLVFPRLNEPDSKYKAEGEYSSKVRFANGVLEDFKLKDGSSFLEALTTMRDELLAKTKKELTAKKQGAKAKTIKAVEVLKAEVDKDTGEETGFIIINAKMRASGVSKKTNKPWKRSPKLFDSKGKVLKNCPNVWGGTEAKVAIEASPYYTPKDNVVGISFRLEAVQILKLVSGTGQSAADYGFGEEDGGFESEAEFDSEDSTDGGTPDGSSDF